MNILDSLLRRHRRQDTTADTTTVAGDTTTVAGDTTTVAGDTTTVLGDTTAAATPAPGGGFSPNPGTPGFACSIDLYKVSANIIENACK
jgi:hypothetical protein